MLANARDIMPPALNSRPAVAQRGRTPFHLRPTTLDLQTPPLRERRPGAFVGVSIMRKSELVSVATAQAAAVILFLCAAIVAGGSARVDAPSLIAVRIAALVAIGAILLPTSTQGLQGYLRVAALPIFVIGVLLVQLIPLPPQVWLSMPGHALYAASAEVAGTPQPWRPWTLMPDATLETLLAMLVPIAALFAAQWAPMAWFKRLPLALMMLAAMSAALAMFQIADGPESMLRWYPVSDNDVGTGFLANRNHQGLLVSLGIPAAVWWAMQHRADRNRQTAQLLISASVILLCSVGAVITQSRAAILWVAIAVALSALAALPAVVRSLQLRWLLGSVLGLTILGCTLLTALPYDRLATHVQTDDRWSFWVTTFDMARTFFPFGVGGGSFVTAYPRFEPLSSLRPEYVNHAHNDALELIAEHGLIGLCLVAGLGWLVVRAAVDGWRAQTDSGTRIDCRYSGIIILLCALASLGDYPLRTPLLMMIFVILLMFNRRSLRRHS